jgi:hypothetical protein
MAKKFKTGELKELLKIQTKKMVKLAQDAIDRIQLDASGGIYQGSSIMSPGGNMYNKNYAKYKRNGMRRFTDGKKLKGYGGRSTNTETRVVNMKLTGDTFRGMTPRGKPSAALIYYLPEHADLILANQGRGYDIYNLHTKNLEFIKNRFGEEIIEPNLKKYISFKTKL